MPRWNRNKLQPWLIDFVSSLIVDMEYTSDSGADFLVKNVEMIYHSIYLNAPTAIFKSAGDAVSTDSANMRFYMK